MKTAITLDLTRPHTKYLGLTYQLSGNTARHITFTFPTWSPGSYMIRDFQADVEAFVVSAKNKKPFFEKISKCQWRIDTMGAKDLTITYQIYAHNMNVRHCYADHEMVFVNGPSVFGFPEGYLTEAVTLDLRLPKAWKCAHAKDARAVTNLHFADFDELYDTPILAARELSFESFRIKNTDYEMAFWGEAATDTKRIARDAQAIALKENALFQETPCRRYLFQVIFLRGQYGGLEHRDSSTNLFDGTQLADKKEYQRFISLLAHEHFHLWNVKRIRPEALGPFDYTKEVYTRDLWIAEGITSYYDDHFLLRAGLYTPESYLAIVTENLNKLENQKANRVNSLSDSSFDAWIRFYRPHENVMNTVVSYYLKGGLIMMALDWRIIRATDGKKTLDDVMRALYGLYKKRPARGITREEFSAAHMPFLGKAGAVFLTDYIDGVKPMDWGREMQPFGLELKDNPRAFPFYLGVILGKKKDQVVVQRVSEDSPAYHSELQPGDEIIAIDSKRMESDKDLEPCLKRQNIKVIFARHGRVYETKIRLTKSETFNKKILLAKKQTPAQKRLQKIFFRT
jgi:predicted metalloprotease with PDZ domain